MSPPQPAPLERAQQGSPAVTGWCPKCKQRAIPMRNGTCGFCDTPLAEDRPAAAAQPAPAPLAPPSVAASEVLDLQLDRLAQIISREHQLVIKAGTAMVEHAIRCGHALIAAKKRVPSGQWEAWLVRNFPDRSTKTWRLYMRLARHEDAVRAAAPSNLNDAHHLLAGEPMLPRAAELLDQATELRGAGLSYREIGEELGVTQNTVCEWFNPATRARRRQREQRLSRSAQREARLAEQDRVVAEYGGDLAVAYGRLREAAETLRELVAQGLAGDVRLALTKTLQAEDLLAKAASAPRDQEVADAA